VNGKLEDPLSKSNATSNARSVTDPLAKVTRRPAASNAGKGTAKQSQKRDSTESGTVPKTVVAASGRVFNNATLVSSALGSAATSMELWSFAKTTGGDLAEELHLQTEKLKKGDLTDVEAMLYCQAVTLQAVFSRTLQHAITNASSAKHQNMMLTLAFKAQA
jgi:hypothetical protein